MTDQELQAIRERVRHDGRWDTEDAIQAFADREALLAEVDRLRAQIAVLENPRQIPTDGSPWLTLNQTRALERLGA